METQRAERDGQRDKERDDDEWSTTAKLYVSSKDGGRGLIPVEDAVSQSILGLENYVSKST